MIHLEVSCKSHCASNICKKTCASYKLRKCYMARWQLAG